MLAGSRIVKAAGLTILMLAAIASAVARAQTIKNPLGQFPPIQGFYEHGAWLCQGGSASYADAAITKFYREGKIELTDPIIDQLTQDYGCKRVNSDNFQAKDFYSDELKIEEKRDSNWGWMGIHSYLLYMRSHVMEPNQAGGDEAWFCSTQNDASHVGQSIAHYQWEHIKITSSLQDPIAKQLAADNHCGIVKLGALKPVELAEPNWDLYNYCFAFKVTDGKHEGWMPLALYLAYSRNHTVSHR